MTGENLENKEVQKTKEPALEDRVKKLERIVGDLVKRIDLDDKPVTIPLSKNNNPDYLPKHGGKPVSLDELPPRKG